VKDRTRGTINKNEGKKKVRKKAGIENVIGAVEDIAKFLKLP